MELNYTTYDNNIYNVTPMTMDTMNYEYIIDNLDNSMNTSLCEPEPNDNIILVNNIKNNIVNILNDINTEDNINGSQTTESSNKLVKLSELYDNFIEDYILMQNKYLECEKNLYKEIEESKSNIKKLELIMKFMDELDESDDNDSLNKNIIENMKLLSKNIEENNNLKEKRKNYIESKKEINEYLIMIKKLNKMNTSNLCPLCLTNTLSIYLNPCGHTCCDKCYERLSNDAERKCFLCRSRIMSKFPLYFS